MEQSTRTHEGLVERQFGPRAQAYVSSPTHSQGEDLDEIEGIVRGHPGARVLDLGCGGGHVSFRSAPHVREVVAYDLSQEMLDAVSATANERGLANIQTRLGRVESLPFEEGSFDFVFTRYSAHHWHSFEAGIREAARVLKPGGMAAFADLISPGPAMLDTVLQAIELFRDPSHVRDFSPDEWRSALTRAGLELSSQSRRRLRLEFGPWIARMNTSEVQATAIRSLQGQLSAEIAEYFEFEPDGSFTTDTMTFVCRKS